jgi:hypothetical protein
MSGRHLGRVGDSVIKDVWDNLTRGCASRARGIGGTKDLAPGLGAKAGTTGRLRRLRRLGILRIMSRSSRPSQGPTPTI